MPTKPSETPEHYVGQAPMSQGINEVPWPPKGWTRPIMANAVDPRSAYAETVMEQELSRKERDEIIKRALSTPELLHERGKTHGAIEDNAYFSEAFFNVMRSVPPVLNQPVWDQLTPTQRLCLAMIGHKIGRILSGNYNEPDHWRDIAGYATLVAERL